MNINDFKTKKKMALMNIFQDFERFKGHSNNFNKLFGEFETKLNKEDFAKLNVKYSMILNYIFYVFANTSRVRVQFDRPLDNEDSLFDDID